MVLFFCHLLCDLILVKLRNSENFNGHFTCRFEIGLGVKFTVNVITNMYLEFVKAFKYTLGVTLQQTAKAFALHITGRCKVHIN
jgi:hypothetical protein